MRRLFRQFSTPGGIPSHVSVPTPGSIHEGGELGYVLTHAFGAAFDNPDLIVAAVVGDGEAETGPLDGLVEGHQLPQPGARRRGAADPAPQRLQDRRPDGARPRRATTTCARCSRATATRSTSSRATTRRPCTRRSPPTLDACYERIRAIQQEARAARRRGSARAGRRSSCARRRAGPGRRRSTACRSRAPSASHQVPLAGVRDRPRAPGACSRPGCGATSPEALFDERGRLRAGAGRAGAAGRPAHGRQPARQRRPAARRPRRCPTSATTRVAGRRSPARAAPREHAPARRDAARRLRPQRRGTPTSASSARTRRTPTGSATCFEVENRCFVGPIARHRRPRLAGRPRDGGAERAQLRGLAGGLHAHRPPRPLRDLRGLRDGLGVDDGPAREVAAGGDRAAVARAGRRRSTSC